MYSMKNCSLINPFSRQYPITSSRLITPRSTWPAAVRLSIICRSEGLSFDTFAGFGRYGCYGRSFLPPFLATLPLFAYRSSSREYSSSRPCILMRSLKLIFSIWLDFFLGGGGGVLSLLSYADCTGFPGLMIFYFSSSIFTFTRNYLFIYSRLFIAATFFGWTTALPFVNKTAFPSDFLHTILIGGLFCTFLSLPSPSPCVYSESLLSMGC